jgi:crossover junction endodeoxyribonuclease RuvC
MIRVLGIDCGSTTTGFGIIESEGRSHRMVTCGVIRMRGQLGFSVRLKQIFDGLQELIQTHSPNVAAVEGVFYSVNARSALKLGQVRGVALLAAAAAGLPVHEYSPLQIKSSVVGYGRAEKSQVQQMVKVLLGLNRIPPEDAADALAAALCHVHNSQTLHKFSQSSSVTRPTFSRLPARL